MSNPKTVVRFVESDLQSSDDISRVIGFVPGKYLLPLFKNSILDANPRRPRVNRVTTDIIKSLDNSPELFQFKSKGILIGTAACKPLQRNRYQLEFLNPNSEGILDGGHNMLSIGLWILFDYMDEKDWNKIKDWDELIAAWDYHYDEIHDDRNELDFLVSVELIIPSSDSEEALEAFRSGSIEICAARNNNSQLAQTARANQQGFYNELRKRLKKKHPELASRVEWKPNYTESDIKKVIKVRDLVAFSWLPLSVLENAGELPDKISVAPNQIYSSKAKISEMFDSLMKHKTVSKKVKDGKYELISPVIGSAMNLTCDLPQLYDWIYLNFKDAYNKNGGSFGNISAVSKPKRGSVKTPYFMQDVEYRIPDGFILPLFYGLKALIEFKNGSVVWKVDPIKFLEEHFVTIMDGYKMPMQMAAFDPQKIAKSVGSYDFAEKQFKFVLM